MPTAHLYSEGHRQSIRKRHPVSRRHSGMRFPLKAQPETPSRSELKFWGGLSAEGLIRKPYPIQSIKSGMRFPPKASAGNIISKPKSPKPAKATHLCRLGALRAAAVQATAALIPSVINRYRRFGPSDYGRIWNPSDSMSRAKPLTVSSEYSIRSLPTFLRLARMPLGTVIIWHPTDSAW